MSFHLKNPVIILILLCSSFILFIRSPFFPFYPTFEGTDTIVYSYMSKRFTMGDLLYRDVWDHKGPLLYWTYAIGYWFTGGAFWGPWLLFLGLMTFNGWLFYRYLLNYLNQKWSLLGGVSFIFLLMPCIGECATTEELMVTPLLICIFQMSQSIEKKVWPRRLFVILGLGALTAAYIKFNILVAYISLGFMACYYVCKAEGYKSMLSKAGVALGIFILGSIVILSYFWYLGTLIDFKEAYLDYNMLYPKTSLADRLETFYATFRYRLSLIYIFGLVFYFKKPLFLSKEVGRYWVGVGLALLFTIMLPGRMYEYYKILWNPFMAMSFIGILYALSTLKYKSVSVIAGLLIFGLCVSKFVYNVREMYALNNCKLVAEQLKSYLKPHDKLWVFGGLGNLNLITGNTAPIRYFYMHAIVANGYAPAEPNKIVQELKKNPPAVIVDWLNPVCKNILTEPCTEKGLATRDITPIKKFLYENYTYKTTLRGIAKLFLLKKR